MAHEPFFAAVWSLDKRHKIINGGLKPADVEAHWQRVQQAKQHKQPSVSNHFKPNTHMKKAKKPVCKDRLLNFSHGSWPPPWFVAHEPYKAHEPYNVKSSQFQSKPVNSSQFQSKPVKSTTIDFILP